MAQLLSLGYFPECYGGPSQVNFKYDIPYVSVTLQEAMRLFWVQKSLDFTLSWAAYRSFDDYCETKITEQYSASYGPDIYANGAFENPEDYDVPLSYYYTKAPINETYLPCYSLARIVCPATGQYVITVETNGNEGCSGGGTAFSRDFFMSLFHDPAPPNPTGGTGGFLILNEKEVLINYGFNFMFSAYPKYTIGTLIGQCEFLSDEDGNPKYFLDVYGPDPEFVGNVTEFSMKIDWNTDTWKFSP